MKKFLLLAALMLSPVVSPLWAQDSSSTNLALGKRAWANSEDVTDKHLLSHATDGNPDTRYAAAQNGDPLEWILDLGKVTSFNSVEIEWEAAYCRTYQIAISADGHNWRQVVSVSGYNGKDHDVKTHDFSLSQARYVRLKGQDPNYGDRPGSFYEFRVFNRVKNGDSPYGVNLALEKAAEASSMSSDAGKAVDGEEWERYGTEENASAPWWKVDLGQIKEFNTIDIVWQAAYAKDFKVSVSQDGDKWEEVLYITGQELPFTPGRDDERITRTYHTPLRNARYVRYDCVTPAMAEWPSSFWEFRVFNYPTPVGVNLALGKKATANSEDSEHDNNSSNATDGKSDTRFAAAKGGNDLEWTLDLNEVADFNTIEIEWEAAYCKKYQILVSTDGNNWKEIVNVTGSNGGNSNINNDKHGTTIDRFDTCRGRYIKLKGQDRALTDWPGSFWEFRVFNNVDAVTPVTGYDIARFKPTTNNKYTRTGSSGDGNDGNYTTRYGATEYCFKPYWEVDLGEVTSFNSCEIVWEQAHAKKFTITVSKDGYNWVEAFSQEALPAGFPDWEKDSYKFPYTQYIDFSEKREARFVRVNCIEGNRIQWPMSFYEFRIMNYPGTTEAERRRVHINTWEGPLNDHGSPYYDGNGINLIYDSENSDDSYDYWYADLNVVPENWDFVNQCFIEIEEKYNEFDNFNAGILHRSDGTLVEESKANDRVEHYFDVREGDKWYDVTSYSTLLGNSRLKFGIDPIRVWVRGKKDYYTNPFDKYEILLATRSHNFDDLDLTAEASPLDYSDYTITVPRGTQLYQLMKGTLNTGEDLVLTLQKKVSNPGFYQINLGRKVTFDYDQNFVFKAKINTTDKDDPFNGKTISDLQFHLTDNNAAYKDDSHYYGVKSARGTTSFIPANIEFDRIILYVDNTKATDDPERYSLQLNNGHDALPYFKDGIRTLHSVPYLKGWCGSGDSNWSNGIAKNVNGNAVTDGGMPAADSDAMTLYWRFSNIDAAGNPLTEDQVKAGAKYHPNAFYLDLPGGVVLSKNFNGATGDSFNGDTSHEYAPTSFNLVDEDGYDAATPRQGGQFFYADTWWAANPRVVPQNYHDSDNWQPDMRYRNGTPGDLAVGETMTCYGITAFRIVGKKYDMYAPEGNEITEGNIWYLYFNTKAEKAGKAELTAPILVNMLDGGQLKMTNPEEYKTYEPTDYLTQTWNLTWEDGQGAGHKEKGKRYFNIPDFGTSSEVSGASNPIMLKLSEINDNWEAVYRLSLDNYKPSKDRTFEVVSVTNSMYWAPLFSDPKNDRILPAKWTRFYRGSSREATKKIDEANTNGVIMDRNASMPYIADPELNYDRLILTTTADNVRYMLHANVPEISPVVDADYIKHENGLGMEQYPDLIYPHVKLHVETPISAVDIMKGEPLVVGVYLRNPDNANLGDASGQIYRYFTEYRINPEDVEIVDSKPVPAGGAKDFKARMRRVNLKYDNDKNFIYTEAVDGKTSVVYLDDKGNEVTDLSEEGPLGPYTSCTIAFHDETVDPDLFLQPNEIVLEFDYDYAMDPDKASVRTGCFLAGNLVKSKTTHDIDHAYTSQSVTLEVPGNDMRPVEDDDEHFINLYSGAYTTTVNYGPASTGNDMPRVYTLYEYDPQSPAWKALCADKLSSYCDEHGIIIPGNEETVLELVKNDVETYDAWGQVGLTRPVMQEVLRIDESDLEGSDKIHEGEFTRVTNHGTPLALTEGFDKNAPINKVEAYLGFVVKMDYTYAYPAGAPIEIKSTASPRARVAHEDGTGSGLEYVSGNVDRNTYYLQSASSYASDWARYNNDHLDMSTTGVELVTSGNMTVKTSPGLLTVGGIDGDCMIFSLSGVRVYNGPAATLGLPAGVYIVTSAGGTAKVMVP